MSVGRQQFAPEIPPSVLKPLLDCTDGHVEKLADILLRAPREVEERRQLALMIRQCLNCLEHSAIKFPPFRNERRIPFERDWLGIAVHDRLHAFASRLTITMLQYEATQITRKGVRMLDIPRRLNASTNAS